MAEAEGWYSSIRRYRVKDLAGLIHPLTLKSFIEPQCEGEAGEKPAPVSLLSVDIRDLDMEDNMFSELDAHIEGQLVEFRDRYEQEGIDKKKVAAGAVGVAGLAGAGTLANSAIKAKRGGESMKSWADMKKVQADNLAYNARRKVGMGYDWKRNLKNAPGKVARAMRMTR